MGIQVELYHRSQYLYERAVALGPQMIQLRPAAHSRTAISSYSLEVTPADHLLNWQFDPLSNQVARVIFPNKTAEFTVDVRLVADLTPYNPFEFLLEPGVETYPFAYTTEQSINLSPYLYPLPVGAELKKFLDGVSVQSQGTVNFLVGLNQRVREQIAYTTRMEHGVQTCDQTLGLGSGSCRDSAWLLVQVLRNLGLASRFVSGYLIQLAEDEPSMDAPGPKVDTTDLHAWAEVFLPGAGWIGLDATSGLLTAEGHIPLVCTPTAMEAAPIWGTVEPAGVEFKHSMTLRRLNEAPRLSKPFSDQEWERVRAVAHEIDRDALAQDIRMTMGGEPTYVAIDDPESMQWNLDALGEAKRSRGLALIRDLRERTAPGGLLHFGQGKWYPGEPLPRWAFHCISRLDGVPVWERGDLIAREDQIFDVGVEDSLAFIKALANRLQVSSSNVLAAFDPNGDENTEPVGYVLPLRRRQVEGRLIWSSQLWFEKIERLVLSFGDSPIGYRIPVEAMPFVAPDELAYETDDDGVVKIPTAVERRTDLFGVEAEADPLPPLSRTAESATVLIRPSLCVQVREGKICVFLPFVPVLADYLDLVTALEDTCRYLDRAIWIEGYTPPADGRMRSFSLTPDPGVLEVNLPPTSGWDDLEALNAVLAEEAHKNRLIAGKFAYDGTHQATGGGSHIVIGAATVADSPFLRRPDLLKSMVTFWQNHPSLSYLFSGMYVGPTSQYPRVDEARADALYELEVSFGQLPKDDCPPATLDGLFRNLLVDVTGNTHRAEFCIDKMFPPENQGLPLGLLELRAFEMAPHYRMGLMQMLLVRALICLFWKQPYEGGLIRWGTALHDRFMLPYFVEKDFKEVLSALSDAGYALEPEWFRTHVEFRFPKIGSMIAHGVEVELRQALEPWNVLAEETNSGRTGRSVDSSLERIQVKVNGLSTEGRYEVVCNGHRVPLVATGVAGEAVAGIRYRARRLYAALHPTIPVHTPLVFDLIDTWRDRSVARCTYYAAPPDGTIYTTRPTDAAEAKERLLKRFVVSATSEDVMVAPEPEDNPVFPMTLDMRWVAPADGASGKR